MLSPSPSAATGVEAPADPTRAMGGEGLDVAFVGTYAPTQCGLATFTASLRDAMSMSDIVGRTGVVRMLGRLDTPTAGTPEVVADWPTESPALGWRSARAAVGDFDVVLLQHEFGIYPGPDGEGVLDFVRDCPTAVVSVLHSVPAAPSPRQRSIIEALAAGSEALVVQSLAARDRLDAGYTVGGRPVFVVPHGAAANLTDATGRPRPDRAPIVLTWGLLGPGKGIEKGLAALAAMADHQPAARYVICGRTHPNVRATHGEAYRDALIDAVRDHGLESRVQFDDRYHTTASLRSVVRNADVVLLPYDSVDQVTSGVLVEALASGKPVVATAFPHATELLADGAGFVVPHDDIAAMTAALERLLWDAPRREAMASRAREVAQQFLWPNVGTRYASLLQDCVRHRSCA